MHTNSAKLCHAWGGKGNTIMTDYGKKLSTPTVYSSWFNSSSMIYSKTFHGRMDPITEQSYSAHMHAPIGHCHGVARLLNEIWLSEANKAVFRLVRYLQSHCLYYRPESTLSYWDTEAILPRSNISPMMHRYRYGDRPFLQNYRYDDTTVFLRSTIYHFPIYIYNNKKKR